MTELDVATVEKYVLAVGANMRFGAPQGDDERRITVLFTYAPLGFVSEEDMTQTTIEADVDVIHLEFEPGKERQGPVNVKLSEDRNGVVMAWPQCNLWLDLNTRLMLVVPLGQDYGFAFDGAALVRVTDMTPGPAMRQGFLRARKLIRAAVGRLPAGRLQVVRKSYRPVPRGTRH